MKYGEVTTLQKQDNIQKSRCSQECLFFLKYYKKWFADSNKKIELMLL